MKESLKMSKEKTAKEFYEFLLNSCENFKTDYIEVFQNSNIEKIESYLQSEERKQELHEIQVIKNTIEQEFLDFMSN
jgi:Ribonuclease G/E